MSLDYAASHLTAGVRLIATSEEPLAERLQTAWHESVQMVWMKPCLTRDLLREFRELWQRYTAPSNDRQSTALRSLTHDEAVLGNRRHRVPSDEGGGGSRFRLTRRTARDARRSRLGLRAGPLGT